MAQELQNKFVIDNSEYKLAVDDRPTMGSDAFVTSGSVFDWVATMTQFGNRSVNDSELVGASIDIPTTGVVYSAVNKKANRDTTTGHLSSDLRHNIIKGTITAQIPASYENRTDSWAGNTYYYHYLDKNYLVYFDSNKVDYKEIPQKGIIYYNEATQKFCQWDGSTFVNLTIS